MAVLLIIIKVRNIHGRLCNSFMWKGRCLPKTRYQRIWQRAQTWAQSNRTGCQEQLYVPFACGSSFHVPLSVAPFSNTSYPIGLLVLYRDFSIVLPNMWQKLPCTSVKYRMVSGRITTVEALRISSSLLSSVVSGLPVFSQNVSVAL